MSNYIRARSGTTYFFTVVTYQRRKILCLEPCRKILREAIKHTQSKHPFTIEAIVLLPEHLHCIWTLPVADTNYSMRWGMIKKEFTKHAQSVVDGLVGTAHPTQSRKKHREGTIWQRRFWEHMIRDDEDMANHVEYIHYNPVKHGLVVVPGEWQHSSFHRYVEEGLYPANWGAAGKIRFAENVGYE